MKAYTKKNIISPKFHPVFRRHCIAGFLFNHFVTTTNINDEDRYSMEKLSRIFKATESSPFCPTCFKEEAEKRGFIYDESEEVFTNMKSRLYLQGLLLRLGEMGLVESWVWHHYAEEEERCS